MERKNDIVQDAYYLVNVAKKYNKKLTQLHVQKLMFLLEAYYMNITDEPYLYECNYQAWNFGPVATQLYKKFKKYGKDDIILTKEEEQNGNNIEEGKKEIIEKLYENFKDFSPMQLVNFTHADGSPWKKAWDNREYSNISKQDMKDWFSQYVIKK